MAGLTEIIGHERVRSRLWNALARDEQHHAYLFEGPAGVGKHLVATRLAMAANCTTIPAGQPEGPCGQCPTCRQFLNGSHPDFLTVRPEPGRATAIIGVDQIREVIRVAGYHRYGANYRFIVIDPAEAMNPSASNALLKTLEEPPAGTGFVLIATHANALLPTILSRCQRVRFGAIPRDDLISWLQGRGLDEAENLAGLSQGCPGRALELAEGGLDAWRQRRDQLVEVLASDTTALFAFTTKLCSGGRSQWMERVMSLVEVLEELLRDVTVQGSGAQLPLLHSDASALIDTWTGALWPTGVAACADAIADLRRDLDVNVAGRTAIDALLSRVAHELGPARNTTPSS